MPRPARSLPFLSGAAILVLAAERVRASAFWFSSDESVAIVHAGGSVRGVAPGTARVRAAQDEHGHNLVGEIPVVVIPSD